MPYDDSYDDYDDSYDDYSDNSYDRQSRTSSPEPYRRRESLSEPMDNRARVQNPTPFDKDPYKRVISESKYLELDSTKLLSYYKPVLNPHLRNDIVYYGYVIHLNLERLFKLLDKPSKKLRPNQKRQFYGITPFGHTVLHVLAVIISRNDETDPKLDKAFKRLLDWEHIDPSHVDHSGKNVFNYLIRHDSEYVRPEIVQMYDLLISRDIYPNPTDELREATLMQNYYPLWSIYYKEIDFYKVNKYIIQNMNENTYRNIDVVALRTTYFEFLWSEINDFLITVNTICPEKTLLFFNSFKRFVEVQRCFGCLSNRLQIFYKHYTKRASPSEFMKTIVTCHTNRLDRLDRQLLEMPDEKSSIFEEATKYRNFTLVEHFLTLFLDSGGLSHGSYETFNSQIEKLAPILVKSRKLDIIQKIIRLTSESIMTKHLQKILKDVRPKIDATKDKEFICSTCWEEYSIDVEGFVFPQCGHFPFCADCFSKMDFCPFCYKQSEDGKTSDMMKAIADEEDNRYDMMTIKLWDMSYSFPTDAGTSTSLVTASVKKPVEASD